MIFQTSDWKKEKHVPVIEIEGEFVKVTVGKEIPHPNTLEHHIKWISLYFWPENDLPVEIGKVEFSAHGEKETYTEPIAYFKFKTNKKGKLVAFSYCNIHGLWKNELEY